MTPTEFLHYLSGFAEACGEHPTKEQWSRILEGLNATLAKANGVSPIARPNNPPALGGAPYLPENAVKPPYVNPKEKWPTKIDAAPTFTLREDGRPMELAYGRSLSDALDRERQPMERPFGNLLLAQIRDAVDGMEINPKVKEVLDEIQQYKFSEHEKAQDFTPKQSPLLGKNFEIGHDWRSLDQFPLSSVGSCDIGDPWFPIDDAFD